MESTKEVLRGVLGSPSRLQGRSANPSGSTGGSVNSANLSEPQVSTKLFLSEAARSADNASASKDIAAGYAARLKAAQSGLTQISSLVEDMKRLAKLGGSATSNAQRFFVYTQIDDLKNEINAIGSRTASRGSMVLDGSLTAPVAVKAFGDTNVTSGFGGIDFAVLEDPSAENFESGDQLRIRIGTTEQVFTATKLLYTRGTLDASALIRALDSNPSDFGFETYRGGIFDGGLEIVSGGTGYSAPVPVRSIPLIGGSGSGASVNITVNNGAITGLSVSSRGSNYASGDVLSLDGAQGAGFQLRATRVFSPLTSTFPGLPDTQNPSGDTNFPVAAEDFASDVRVRLFQTLTDSPPPDGTTEVGFGLSGQSGAALIRSFMDVQIRPLGMDSQGIATLGPIIAQGNGYPSIAATSEPIKLVEFQSRIHPRGGADAMAVFSSSGGAITQIHLVDAGSGYRVGDRLTLDPATGGNAFLVEVAAVSGGNSSPDTFVFDRLYRAISDIAAPSGQTTTNFKTLELVLGDFSSLVTRRIRLADTELAGMEATGQLFGSSATAIQSTNESLNILDYFKQRKLNTALFRTAINDSLTPPDLSNSRLLDTTLSNRR